MYRRNRSADDDSGVNVTPLLDIVFIMLIFFIVTATFIREKGIDLTLPNDCEDCPEHFGSSILLAIQEDGFVRINNVRTIDPGSVKPTVQAFMAQNPNGLVLVTAPPDSESGVVIRVMDQAAAGGAKSRVSFAMQEAEI